MASILHKPSSGRDDASGSSAGRGDGGEAADHGHGPEGATATVAATGDLCKPINNDPDAEDARQEKANHTTRHGDAWDSMPVEVWQNKDRKVLTAYVGVVL